MKEDYKILSTAPWSNQKVSTPIQFLAWTFTICGLFSVAAIIYFTFKEGISNDNLLLYLGMTVGLIYYLTLFGYVAIKGKAPEGWLPWK